MSPDALPYLPPAAGRIRLHAWWHRQAPFLAAYVASRWWRHARINRKDSHG